jgi:two-component system chemotaxis response regulator CheB
MLARRLDALSDLTVTEATGGLVLTPGTVLIAPGAHHLTIERDGTEVRTVLTEDPPEHSCRPSACVLFRSAFAVYGPHLLAAVLTGMGDDGSHGARTIREGGGQVIAQDEASSVVWGMPGAVVREGVAERELPLDEIAPEIVRRVAAGRVDSRTPSGVEGSA